MAAARVGGASIRDRRAHQGRVPRVEPAAICHGPSRASGTRDTVSATHRGGAGRDHPSRPPHGARTPRAGRPGRDRAEDRTKNVTLNRNHPIDLEGLRPREPRPGDLSRAPCRRSTTTPRPRSTGASAWGSRPRSWPASTAGRGRASIASSTRCGPGGSWATSSSSSITRPSTTRRTPRRSSPSPRAGRWQGPPASQGAQGPAALPGEPLRGPAAGSRAGDAPVPQDELPEVPRPRAAARRSNPTRAKTADLDEIERLQEEALAVKNQIIRANLRLVVSIAKRHVGPVE